MGEIERYIFKFLQAFLSLFLSRRAIGPFIFCMTFLLLAFWLVHVNLNNRLGRFLFYTCLVFAVIAFVYGFVLLRRFGKL